MIDSIATNRLTISSRQRGSLLVVAMIVVLGVGTISASMVNLIKQNAVSNSDEIRYLQGMGAADSMRLAHDKGLNINDVILDLRNNTDYQGGNAHLEMISNSGADWGVGYRRTEDSRRWGYRFRFLNGTGGGYDNVNNIKECEISGDEIVCDKFNKGQAKKLSKLVYFEEDTIIKLNPQTDLDFDDLIVEGDLTIEKNNEGANNSTICVKNHFKVKGSFSDPDGLYNTSGGCEPKKELTDVGKWTFKR